MSDINAKGFLNLLGQSGLVTQEQLKPALATLSQQAGGKPVSLDQLTDHLVESKLITPWHVQKIKSGRYKGFFLGKYKLLSHLGTGGMSTVYLAQHSIFNQERAVKVLPKKRVADRSYLDRFYREGRAAASLNHKNIVRVYDIDNDGDTHYLVMEYVDGRDLYDIVKQSGPLDFRVAIDYTIQALIGLQHAHENNLVHRDIKPANLLVSPGGVVKILDLGLALLREDDASLTVMHNERVLGTADYLSPEQAVDSHLVDHRADIYSLGCTLYFMVTGQPPFPEGTLAQRIAKHQTQQPASVRSLRADCPVALQDVCNQMMAKQADDRYQSCEELIPVFQSLRDLLPTKQVSAAAPMLQTQPRRDLKSSEEKPKSKIAKAPSSKIAKAPHAEQSPGPDAAPAKPSREQKLARREPKPTASAAPHQPKPAKRAAAKHSNNPKSSRDPRSQGLSIKTEESPAPMAIGITEFREFARQHPRKPKRHLRRNPEALKNQIIVTAIVLGMLLMLALVLGLAMRFTQPSESRAGWTDSGSIASVVHWEDCLLANSPHTVPPRSTMEG